MIHFDLQGKKSEIEKINNLMVSSSFWDNQKKAQLIIRNLNELKEIVETYNTLFAQVTYFIDELNILREKYDAELHEILEDEYLELKKKIDDFEMLILLNEKFDHLNAIIEIHPGAGGTESQDWAEMLYRMYVRYAERQGYKIETLDYQVGEEAGIKSVSFVVSGHNAYGYLKSEKGVHRLVRISPFDSSGRRHTSFASVDVIPEFSESEDIIINEMDLKIDTYHSSGAGGQHVNKTESAVRITHIPSGIVVSCQSQRSQLQNKEHAMAALKAKLYQKSLLERENELNKIRGEQKLIGWGSQIRSYIFMPYLMVKDHRSNFETSDVNGVMDGKIDSLIYAYLKMGVK